ncbi:MAG: hypothetical protein APF83_03285 [Lutibacter sp. BRH_c52]|nr:MAG: hypothetical protein APF83_03285 [Lutibacter sp. BRH_c52]HCE53899.1 hypothetical protein [Lutibacter sp.]
MFVFEFLIFKDSIPIEKISMYSKKMKISIGSFIINAISGITKTIIAYNINNFLDDFKMLW